MYQKSLEGSPDAFPHPNSLPTYHLHKFPHSTQQSLQIGVLKSRTGIRATISHVLGSRALKKVTVTIEQVQLGIVVKVQL